MPDFSAQVSNWTKQTRQRINAVYRTAIDMTVDDMLTTKREGGNLPIDTGNLRRSFLLSTTGLPNLGGTATGDTSLVLAGVNYGDTVYGGFQAVYARRLNAGFTGTDSAGRSFNQSGNYFLDLAVAKWVQNVKSAERKLMTR